jgi:hypothetical protein
MPKCPHCQKEITVKLTAGFGGGTSFNPPSEPADTSDLEGLMNSIDENVLNDFEKQFYEKLKPRYEKWGAKTAMSEKQMGVLRRMANKGF